MKTTSTLELNSSFSKKLLNFDDPAEWAEIANLFALEANNARFNDAIWDINTVIQNCEKHINSYKEKAEIIQEWMKDAGITKDKKTWRDNDKLTNFKHAAEKFNFAVEHLQNLHDELVRLKKEFADSRDGFYNSSKLANNYLLRLSKIGEKEED